MNIKITEENQEPKLDWDNVKFPVIAYWDGSTEFDRLFILALENVSEDIVEGSVRGLPLNGPLVGTTQTFDTEAWKPYDGNLTVEFTNVMAEDEPEDETEEFIREVARPTTESDRDVHFDGTIDDLNIPKSPLDNISEEDINNAFEQFADELIEMQQRHYDDSVDETEEDEKEIVKYVIVPHHDDTVFEVIGENGTLVAIDYFGSYRVYPKWDVEFVEDEQTENEEDNLTPYEIYRQIKEQRGQIHKNVGPLIDHLQIIRSKKTDEMRESCKSIIEEIRKIRNAND